MNTTGTPPRKSRKTLPRRAAVRDTSPVPRERILNAAAKLFRDQGYQRTTVREIADRVGILSGSLFHHFRTKEDMLLEIMREAALSICIRAEEVASRATTPLTALRDLIRLELDCVVGEDRKDYHAVLFLEWREVPEPAKPEFTMLRRRYARIWHGVLDLCMDKGWLRCEPGAALRILHGAMNGAMIWFKPSGTYTAEEYGDILVRLVLKDDALIASLDPHA
ncbi:MAG: TetR/AcrR family transcriptional regulator [Pseudomonadota bacterium]